MKKYRCLLYKSTTNHNILYFLCIPGIPFLNTAICLWKAQNTQAKCGFRFPKLLQNQCRRACRAKRSANSSLASPARAHKAQKQCRFDEFLWRCGDSVNNQPRNSISLTRFKINREFEGSSRLKVTTDWDHLLMQNSNYPDSIGNLPVKYDVPSLLVPSQSCADRIAFATHFRLLG
jgi:hypothetical protein